MVAVLSIDANDNVTDSGTRITIPNGIPLAPGYNGGAPDIAIAADGRAYIGNNAASITMVDTKTDTILGIIAVPNPSAVGVPK